MAYSILTGGTLVEQVLPESLEPPHQDHGITGITMMPQGPAHYGEYGTAHCICGLALICPCPK